MKSTKGELLAEFIGSFILIFIGAGCVASLVLNGSEFGMWEISIIWGMGIAVALYMVATISGAHINPAVTFSLALYRGFPWKKVIPYTLAQIAGTFSAAATVFYLYYPAFMSYQETSGIVIGSPESQGMAGIFSTYPAPYLTFITAGIVEVAITAFLIAAIFCFIDERNTFAPPPFLFPLAVGILVAIIGGAFGSLTGFAMNPARDFGPKLFMSFAGWGEVAFGNGYFLVPLIAPLIGAVIGGAAYDFLVRRNLPPLEKKEAIDDLMESKAKQSV